MAAVRGRYLAMRGSGYDPTWSPDSSRIAFASKRDGSVQLYTIRANGDNLRRLTRGVSGIGGRQLVFINKLVGEASTQPDDHQADVIHLGR